jgi:hypothetical protein
MASIKFFDPDPEQQINQEAVPLLRTSGGCPGRDLSLRFCTERSGNMSIAETAACLDLTQEAVKLRLLRARQMRKSQLYMLSGATSCQAFQFLGAHCDRVVSRVFNLFERTRDLINPHSRDRIL